MAGKGPPPKDPTQRRRRNATPGFMPIMADARAGKPAPAWPVMAGEQTPAEAALWAKLWSLPQADEWLRLQCEEDVAIYCRFKAATLGSTLPDTKLSTEARLLDAKLGVTPQAMVGLRWQIVDPPDAQEQTADPATSTTSSSDAPEPPARTYVPKSDARP